MLARLTAASVFGIEAVPVTVEVDVTSGLPGVTMVGLPDATVRESRERVRAAIRNSGFPFPGTRVTVSLVPADLKKVGTAFDLPVALGILAASGSLPSGPRTRMTIVGGLSLDGGTEPLRGVLPVAVSARVGGTGLMCPVANAPEALVVDGVDVHGVSSLAEAARVLSQEHPTPLRREALRHDPAPAGVDDLADVRGQWLGRRALEIAAAGGHHLLLSGPPGAGKTMLARRLPGLLPPLGLDEALTVTTIHSVAGLLRPGSGLVWHRPFRAPHHTCSDVALVGGGSLPRPGELSLAHRGVLFLDELPEFSRRVLETLRQPLEEGVVRIARASQTACFPSDVMLVAAMNPCPCGFLGLADRSCRCPPALVERYARRLSGPLRDRFDLAVEMGTVSWDEMRTEAAGESSAAVSARVHQARRRQQARSGVLNASLRGRALRAAWRTTDADAERLLGRGASRLQLSVRAVTRVMRVARTIADLAESDAVLAPHVSEALQFRLPGQMA